MILLHKKFQRLAVTIFIVMMMVIISGGPWLLLCGMDALYYGKISIWKIKSRIVLGTSQNTFWNSFTLMLIIEFSLCSSCKCYVSPKGWILFLIIPCISILHEKLLFKWTTAQGTKKIYESKEQWLDFLSIFCLCGDELCKKLSFTPVQRGGLLLY